MKKHHKTLINIDQRHYQEKEPYKISAKVLYERFKDRKNPVIIAIGGPGGTGKTTFAKKLSEKMQRCAVLSLDDYKVPRSERASKNIFGPHPEANQMELIAMHMALLKQGRDIEKPIYCRKHGRALESVISP